jgi:hypothetical protein
MKKISITYGLIAGLIAMSFMIVSTILWNENNNSNQSMIIGFIGMFISFIFVFIGIKKYRDKENGGNITFVNAFKIGFFIALITSSIYTIVWLIQVHFFMPDFMEKYAAKAIEEIKSSNLSAAEITEKVTEMELMRENYKILFYRICYTLMEILPIGIVIALISALILKRKVPLNEIDNSNGN